MRSSQIHRNVKSTIPMVKRDSEMVAVAAVLISVTYLEACSEWAGWAAAEDALRDPRRASLSYTLSRPH